MAVACIVETDASHFCLDINYREKVKQKSTKIL